MLFSSTFFGGASFDRLLFLVFTLSFEFESSFSAAVNGEESFSSTDFLELCLDAGESLALFDDLLSDSDSELLSGENILFFFTVVSDFDDFDVDLDAGLDVFAPADTLDADLPLARTKAADFNFVERLLGGKDFGLLVFGASSSLDDETLAFEGRLCLGSSFFLVSSEGGVAGDFGAVVVVAAGVPEVDESESELDESESELVDELRLLLESDEDSELLSVLLLLTSKYVIMLNYYSCLCCEQRCGFYFQRF